MDELYKVFDRFFRGDDSTTSAPTKAAKATPLLDALEEEQETKAAAEAKRATPITIKSFEID